LGGAAQFQASASATSCTGTPSFAWTFGDGATSTDQNPSHTYGQVGSYDWIVTVSQDGQSCSSSGTLSVTAPPVVQPTFTSFSVVGGRKEAVATWTASNETSVVGYIVMDASSSTPLTGEIAVQGGSYSVTLNRVDAKAFMVRATLTDGTTADSQIATFQKGKK
jgi:PKD repeat protein